MSPRPAWAKSELVPPKHKRKGWREGGKEGEGQREKEGGRVFYI